MARIFTTPAAEQAAKVLMHDITVAGGLNTNNLRTNHQGVTTIPSFISASQNVCKEITERNFDNLDSALAEIARWYHKPSYDGSGKNKSFTKETVAKVIIWFADKLGLYWDDTVRTPYEIAEFKKTVLGDAVYKYGRYISAVPDKPVKTRANNAPGVAGGAAAGGAKQPKNTYKYSGGQSANARDLRDLDGVSPGKPGNKVFAGGPFIYRIIGDDPTITNTPNVFVNPLSASGAAGNTNKVKFGSGNGYSDCTCFFDDPNDANDFLNKIIQNNVVPAKVSNPRVVKGKADSNGYFLVGTEFGVCAISAKKLNEALVEAMDETPERTISWEKATEGYSKEKLDELHTWMRRD